MNLAEIIVITKDFLSSIAILVGGAWAIWKFFIKRESFAKIQFDVDLNLIEKTEEHFVVEIIGIFENKGSVRQYIKSASFALLYLKKDMKREIGDYSINHQLLLKHLGFRNEWIPQNRWHYSFVDPGVKQEYRFLIKIPGDIEILSIHGRFLYPNDEISDFHTSQKTFNLNKIYESNFEH